MSILSELRDRFRAAFPSSVEDPAEYLAMIRPSQNPKFGDYQANFAMPLGKRFERPPHDVANEIADRINWHPLADIPQIAGPGFINLRLRDDWIAAELERARHDPRLGVRHVPRPLTYVVDFSSPNVAKEMHVGHIRSTVIGDALCRTLKFLGHRVISDNHLGDWGTQFGMIIYGYRHFVDREAFERQPIQELARLYRFVRQLMDLRNDDRSLPQREQRVTDLAAEITAWDDRLTKVSEKESKPLKQRRQKTISDLAEAERVLSDTRARLQAAAEDRQLTSALREHKDIEQAVLAETAQLHAGSEEHRSLWKSFLPYCLADIDVLYHRIGVAFDHQLGESFYHDRLDAVVDSLTSAGLVTESDGATCVFLDGFAAPMIIRKQDGAFLYATTDLATIEYRVQTWDPDVILYVVDVRQGEHFEKLFAAAKLWRYADKPELRHISFGTVLGPDGKPFKTRSGDTVGLAGLLDEAEQRAYRVVSDNDEQHPQGPQLSEADRRRIAKVVGIAAIKYADLSQNRTSDYVFSYDKMLALNGNTSTYMQYSYARVHGIFGKGDVNVESLRDSDAVIQLEQAAERSLGLQLLRFEEALEEMLVDYKPNMLTNYLYELAKVFSTFFEECPVLKADSDAVRNSRLLLCDLTARTLKLGLNLLGIEVVERM